jgi:hypothetical protein
VRFDDAGSPKHNLTDAFAKVTIRMSIKENGVYINKFFADLELEKNKCTHLKFGPVHP